MVVASGTFFCKYSNDATERSGELLAGPGRVYSHLTLCCLCHDCIFDLNK